MILANTKFKNFFDEPTDILRVFLALVFLSAGLFRLFNYSGAGSEFSLLNLPISTIWLVIIFEIGAGTCLLINKFVKIVYYLLLIFIIFALIWAFVISGPTIAKQFGELFVFNLNPTDIFLHFVFFLIIITLLFKKNK